MTNALGQVTTVTAWDWRGAPTSVTYPNGVVTTLSYDIRGRLLTADVDPTGSPSLYQFSYDAVGDLTQVILPMGATLTAFAYDGLGRRIQITSTPPGGGTATTTNYVWCGMRLCEARSSGGAATKGYYAEGEYAVGSAASAYYAPDRLDSVRRVFTSTSSPTYDYDPYGAPLQTTAPVTDFNYAGMFYNADSGLYLATYRPYDPTPGRWLSRDPIGEGGDPLGNLYAYVDGDPVNLSDRNGFCADSPPPNEPPRVNACISATHYCLQNLSNAERLSCIKAEIICNERVLTATLTNTTSFIRFPDGGTVIVNGTTGESIYVERK